MKKILLVQPPMEEFYLTRKRTLPYGLASICAGLEVHGYLPEIFDALATDKSKPLAWPLGFSQVLPYFARQDISLFSLFHEFRHFGYSLEHIASQVREKKPFLVGISSLFSAYASQALATARIIKKFYPQAWIVLGGHHPTLFPQQVMACPSVDFVLRGEGEICLPQLCDALTLGTDLKKVPGLVFRRDKKLIIRSPAWIKDLNTLPLPALDRVNQAYYQRKAKAAVSVVASRGCPMPCSYCSVSSSSSHAGFRQREVGQVLREIQEQADHLDIGFIDFEDENLTLNKPWFMALLSGLGKIFKEKSVELRAMNGLYPLSLDQTLLTAMKNGGFKTLNLSVGSFSREQLARFHRPDVRKAHDRVVDMAQELGMTCVSYVIAAAPGQDALSSLDDLVYLAEKRTLVGLSIFYPAPGSRDYALCQAQNLLPQRFSLMRSTALPIEDKTSRLEAITLWRLARILNFLKACLDQDGSLPQAEACTTACFPPGMGMERRTDISRKLVQWFLNDGLIRGADKKGNVYIHKTDGRLCQTFIRRIQTLSLKGVTR